MYLSSFQLQNVKCFRDASLTFPKDEHGGYAGWFVLLGENGTGKSTLLQAMSLALVGPQVAAELVDANARQRWVRREAPEAVLLPTFAAVKSKSARPLTPKLKIAGPAAVRHGDAIQQPYTIFADRIGTKAALGFGGMWTARPSLSVVALGYGPRRQSRERGQPPQPFRGSVLREQARHATLFDADARLVDGDWLLPTLYNLANDSDAPEQAQVDSKLALDRLVEVINRLLSEEGVEIARVRPTGLTYRDRLGQPSSLDDLSDGFRSFLSLVIDLLAHICFADPSDPAQGLSGAVAALNHLDEVEGVVLIDEADIHLHPTWQRALGPRLRAVFPRLQFIVSSHSPFIAQAATQGGLFRLAAANDEVTITTSTQQPQGWTADELLLSDLFGLTSTRGVETDAMMAKRQALLAKKARTSSDDQELRALELELQDRLTGPGVDLQTRELMNKAWQLLGGPRRAS